MHAAGRRMEKCAARPTIVHRLSHRGRIALQDGGESRRGGERSPVDVVHTDAGHSLAVLEFIDEALELRIRFPGYQWLGGGAQTLGEHERLTLQVALHAARLGADLIKRKRHRHGGDRENQRQAETRCQPQLGSPLEMALNGASSAAAERWTAM